VRSAQIREAYASATSEIYQIERRVDHTNPRTPEVCAQGLRDLHAATNGALAAVETLLALRAAGDTPERLDEQREGPSSDG
jgi:hypothetical protein